MFGKQFFGLRGSNLNWAIGVIAGLDFLLFGYDQGVMGGLLTLDSFVKVFPEIDTRGKPSDSPTSITQGISIASYNLGCFSGAIVCIWLGEYLGRRRTIFVGSAIMVVGAIIQASAINLTQLIVGRVITGLGNGLNTSTVPTWQSETSRSHKRGQMVMIEGALITGGIMISYWIDFALSFAPGEVAWRFPIAFQILFALIILCFILGLPESPRWLILKGRETEAATVLAVLRDLPENDEQVQSEFVAIKDSVVESSKGSFKAVFTNGKDRNFHRALLGFVNQTFQQISGCNLITYYAATIYENEIGLSGTLSRILAACCGTEYFLVSWIAVFTIERIGRRPLMIFGAVGTSFSMTVLAIATSFGGTGPGIVAAIFLFVFNTFFAVGWLGMTWLYPSEIVPLSIRAPSNALSTSANWIFNFMVVMITPVAFAKIGYQTYIIFAVINAFIVPCVWFFYPETAYRSLEEMDDIFRKVHGWKGALDVVRVARPEHTPHKFDKHGDLLVDYLGIEEDQHHISVAGGHGVNATEKATFSALEDKGRSLHNEDYRVEAGFASSSDSGNEKTVH